MNISSFRQLWQVMSKVAAKLDGEQSGIIALERLSSWFGRFAEMQGGWVGGVTVIGDYVVVYSEPFVAVLTLGVVNIKLARLPQ